MKTNNYSFEVLVNGRPVTEHSKDSKIFIEARNGTEYSLRLKNNSHERILAVFSVDGIEVIGGKVAGDSKNGYIIDAYSNLEVKGYRINNESVANFKFADGNKSYAAEVGAIKKDGSHLKTKENNGVLGVRIFTEKHNISELQNWFIKNNELFYDHPLKPFKTPPDTTKKHTFGHWDYQTTVSADLCKTTTVSNVCRSANLDYASNVSPNFNIGTTWGNKSTNKVTEVSFQASDDYTDMIIYYASKESLIKHGIDFNKNKKINTWPNAFNKSEYCKPPSWFKSSEV